jgi:hypothetical protein
MTNSRRNDKALCIRSSSSSTGQHDQTYYQYDLVNKKTNKMFSPSGGASCWLFFEQPQPQPSSCCSLLSVFDIPATWSWWQTALTGWEAPGLKVGRRKSRYGSSSKLLIIELLTYCRVMTNACRAIDGYFLKAFIRDHMFSRRFTLVSHNYSYTGRGNIDKDQHAALLYLRN